MKEHCREKRKAERMFDAAERLLSVAKSHDLLSVSAIAEACGISEVAVNKWRSGMAQPGIDTIIKFCCYIGISPAYFFAGSIPDKEDPMLDEEKEEIWRHLDFDSKMDMLSFGHALQYKKRIAAARSKR